MAIRWGVAMKKVRRVHMYLGLLMWPWVLLYGLSGMLFNHPGVGRDLQRVPVPADRLREVTGFTPWSPQNVAEAVVAAVNGDGDRYTLAGEPKLVGFPIFVSPAEDSGRHVMIMSLTSGRAGVAHRPPAPTPTPAPFAGPVATPQYTLTALEEQLAPLLPALGVDAPALKAHPKAGPELHLQLDDGEQLWNAVYDPRTGTLAGRPVDANSQLPFIELLGRLHTQHHFPVHWGVSGFWAIMADLAGLSLALWALTGLFMWWQITPTRKTGTIVLALSIGLAAAVMLGMANELTFLVRDLGTGP